MKRRRLVPRWTVARRLVALVFLALLFLGRFDWFPWFKGAATATTAFGRLPFADPLAALEVLCASRSWQTDLFVGAALLLGFALFFGPVFCGWVCPLGLVLDLNESVRRRLLGKKRLRKGKGPALRLPRGVRYGVLGAVLGFAIVAGLPLFQTLSPINLLVRSIGFAWDPFLLVLGGLLVIELVAPRLWCRSLCPLGAVYSLCGRVAPFRVRVHPETAGRLQCGQCTVHCPMGIEVMGDYTLAGRTVIDDPECTRCGACLDACPGYVLRLGFRSSVPAPVAAPPPE